MSEICQKTWFLAISVMSETKFFDKLGFSPFFTKFKGQPWGDEKEVPLFFKS
jgi:hypothetical protein